MNPLVWSLEAMLSTGCMNWRTRLVDGGGGCSPSGPPEGLVCWAVPPARIPLIDIAGLQKVHGGPGAFQTGELRRKLLSHTVMVAR